MFLWFVFTSRAASLIEQTRLLRSDVFDAVFSLICIIYFSPMYSATFMEGRLMDHKALYLDQTTAFILAPYINLGMAFTIACWIKLLPSNPYLRPILGSDNGGSPNGRFWFGVDKSVKLRFKNWHGGIGHTKTSDQLQEKQWLHVAVSFVDSIELTFFINGFQHPSTVPPWQSPVNGPLTIGRFFAEVPSGTKYRHFHGFLSDLYVFSRALNAEEIGRVMGK